MRRVKRIAIDKIPDAKRKLLHWAAQFDPIFYLDSNDYQQDKYSSFECLIGIGALDYIRPEANYFDSLKRFYDQKSDWLFGYFTYDLKNEIETLYSHNYDGMQTPPMQFVVPRWVLVISEKELSIHFKDDDDPTTLIQETLTEEIPQFDGLTQLELQPRISKRAYLESVEQIITKIGEGAFYEMNLCMEFFSEQAQINPVQVFDRLNRYSEAPFSAYMQIGDQFLMCSSPERFLKKRGDKLISQPIKGTIRRGWDQLEDEYLTDHLLFDPKERAENVMIVDLVRNDLTKSAEFGSIQVEELFGVYSFKHVHHLISTVSAQLGEDVHPIDSIRNAFPMGSMTGAPKVEAMKWIEHFEQSKRGLFSGSVGYITPDGDFDFNVVIRSLLYNNSKQYLSMQIGGAITYQSVPEKEYAECMLKAKGMMEVLSTTWI